VIVERLLRIALVGSSWVLYLLLALSVLSIGVILERALYFRRHRDDVNRLRAGLRNAVAEGDHERAEALLAKSRSIEARILHRAWVFRTGGADAVSDAIDSELAHARQDLERGTLLLGTLGNNAPFIGLFGTVLGVIEAFHQLGASGQNQGAMGNVMAAIAEALVATGVGLFVALPAVVAYNILQKRIGDIETGAISLGKLVTASLKAEKYVGAAAPSANDAEENDDSAHDEVVQAVAAGLNGKAKVTHTEAR
jgi:biopolymer transport protein ExbB/biopolymer transport protein TolQ